MSMNSALRALNLQVNIGGMETLLMPTRGETGLGWGKALQAKLPTSNHHSLCLAAGSAAAQFPPVHGHHIQNVNIPHIFAF